MDYKILKSKITYTLAAVAVIGISFLSGAVEYIESFDVELTVHLDGSVDVVEHITVHSEGREIRRGIYRDIIAPRGATVRMDSVRRDGRDEPWHTESTRNGKRFYLGKQDVFLSKGKHSYDIRYEVTPGIVRESDNDQLYWNVTGNDWAFRIDHATAHVRFPDSIPGEKIQHAAFAGRTGAKATAFRAEVQEANTVFFETTRPLRAGEGLTVVVGAARGYFKLRSPSIMQRIKAKSLNFSGEEGGIHDLGAATHSTIFTRVSLIALGVPLIYFTLAWIFVGIDPRSRSVRPLTEPPAGLSPAAMRYITKMKYDTKTFAVALTNMAVLGHIRITRKGESYKFSLADTKRRDLTAEGKVVSKALGLGKGQTVSTTQTLGAPLRIANEALLEYLDDTYRKVYFSRNTKYWLMGVVLSSLALGVGCMSWGLREPVVLWLMLMAFTICAVYALQTARTIAPAIRFALSREGSVRTFLAHHLRGSVMLIALGFGVAILGLFVILTAGPGLLLYAIILAGISLLFGYLLPAPTKLGRAALDSIEGFELFLKNEKSEAQRFLSNQTDIARPLNPICPMRSHSTLRIHGRRISNRRSRRRESLSRT